ncbi:MAG: PD-(D/E)XK nuclease family protein [Myxococcota bacterium]
MGENRIRGGVRVLRGARRVQADLLDAVDRALDVAPDAPGVFERPLRVVVPSRSLRQHVSAAIAAHRGRAAVGLRVDTLGGLAFELLSRAGEPVPDPLLFGLHVRREARRERALAEALEDRVDGYAAVAAAVDDLLDAGFEPAHADVLEEHLAEQGIGRDAARRARALVRVAARVAARLAAPGAPGDGPGHRSQWMVRAREALLRDPDRLPQRALFLYGFADATGVQADLVSALVERLGATLWLDAPPDPTHRERRAGPRFGAAYRERFAGAGEPAGDASEPAGSTARGRVALLRAPTPAAEVRAVARRLRDRIDAGTPPERLAVVARDLSPFRTLLRGQLRRHGVPFSGADATGAATAERRRIEGLLRLVAPDASPSMETWLDVRDDLGPVARADLRSACHRRGAVRVEDVAPALGASGASRAAAALLAALAARPGRAPLAEHADWLRGVVRVLGWRDATPGHAAVDAALGRLPAAPEVDAGEFASLLARGLEPAGWAPLGGVGGGVQVLTVMEARARCFDGVFVLGLQRGAFPRSVREDPLLPDAVRARLREVLPDLPIKRDGHDEERFLFAQLLCAGDEVTLCWSDTGFEGRPQPRSPLLESVERAGLAAETGVAPPLHAPEPVGARLPVGDHLLQGGLYAPRSGFGEALARAVGEPEAAARLAVLQEIDPRDGRREELGPYFGFVGDVGADEVRGGPLYVTRLEAVARCPWQAFLTRVLRLAPVPDAAGDLPAAADARLLGNVVHGVLERIVDRPLEDPAELSRDARPVAWPDPATLDDWLLDSAREAMRDDAIALPGYARVLAERARPLVERARLLDWTPEPPRVVATEAHGVARVTDANGRSREILFKADRVDRVGQDLVFVDYKTGKSDANQKTPARRLEAFRQAVAAGRLLQAGVYARSVPGSRGRYLFLSDKVNDEARLLEADASLDPTFDATLATLLEVWDRGSFLPRLRQADRDEEPGSCRFCEVRDACLRGDSGARRRVERWGEGDGASQGAAERAALAAYALGVEA